MSDLKYAEIRKLEELLNMGSGYVLDFYNSSFSDFVENYTGIDIFDEKYNERTGSKANRLRAFWKKESNYNVGILINAFIDYIHALYDTAYYNGYVEKPTESLISECKNIADRLLKVTKTPNIHVISSMEDIGSPELQQDIRQKIAQGKPGLALDRLHTLLMKFFRQLCEKYSIPIKKNYTLNALVGMYVKKLQEMNVIQSEMTVYILKTSISIFEKFNPVRNDFSYAHDNPILNSDESTLVVNNIINIIQFITALERKIQTLSNQEQDAFDDVPF